MKEKSDMTGSFSFSFSIVESLIELVAVSEIFARLILLNSLPLVVLMVVCLDPEEWLLLF